MTTYADKTQEDRNKAVSDTTFQRQSSSESAFQFIDNRPDTITQRKLQELADNCLQGKTAFQLPKISHRNESVQEHNHTSKQLRSTARARSFIQPASATSQQNTGPIQRAVGVAQMVSDTEFNDWVRNNVIRTIPDKGVPKHVLTSFRKNADAKFRAYALQQLGDAGLTLAAADWDDMDEILRQYTFVDSRFGQQPQDGDHSVDQGWAGVHTDASPDDAAYTVGLLPCVALGLILHKGANFQSRVALAHFDSSTDVRASIIQLLQEVGATPDDAANVQAFLAGGADVGHEDGLSGPELFAAMDAELQAMKIGYIERHPNPGGDVMNVRMTSEGMSGFK